MKQLNKLVASILTTDRRSRYDDDYLYIKVVEFFNPNCKDNSFEYVFENRRKLFLPSYESVSRARRNVQSLNKNLRPSKKQIEERKIAESKFYCFYKKC